MKRILLCPPDFYDIEYEINPWMHKDNDVVSSKAHEEYEQIKKIFLELGAEIHEIKQVKGLPDMVYTANCGEVVGNTFIVAKFRYKERQGESAAFQEYFEKEFGFKTVALPEGVYFEGQGDLLNDGTRYFFGWGKRSSREAKEHLETRLNAPVFAFETINPYYYHLDTCFAPLSEEIVMINQRSFNPEDLALIHTLFPTVIETSEEDNKVLACNLVHIGKNIVVNDNITDALKRTLKSHGYTVHGVETAEYIKGGGSAKCISFEF